MIKSSSNKLVLIDNVVNCIPASNVEKIKKIKDILQL